jgi:hypothetical protein
MGRIAVLLLTFMVGAGHPLASADSPTIVRVFNLQYTSVSEASNAVQPLLSENGTLTVQPQKSRITVQDTQEVIAQVAELLAELDTAPKRYQILVRLIEGTDGEVPESARADVHARVTRMFPFPGYRRIGSTLYEGELGTEASAAIGDGFRLSFFPSQLRVSKDSAWGIPDVGIRIQLQELTLEKLGGNRSGDQVALEVIRTDVHLSPKQEVIIGAGASEDSSSGLVLILRAESIGGR